VRLVGEAEGDDDLVELVGARARALVDAIRSVRR
jgi:hypothetical protein